MVSIALGKKYLICTACAQKHHVNVAAIVFVHIPKGYTKHIYIYKQC